MNRVILILLISFTSLNIHASDSELNQTLVRVINQLNAIMPLLDEAKNEVEPNSRMQLHIENFKGADGMSHSGLRTDLLNIRQALIDYINKPVIAPKTIKPLTLDFVGK